MRKRARSVLAFLVGSASVTAFLVVHTAMGWLHLLLAPLAIYLAFVYVLARRERARHTPTEVARRRYDRIAPLYDWLEALPELRSRRWRREQWQAAEGTRVLEIGVGTGRSIGLYPAGKDVVAVDLSDKMLARARQRAARLGSPVRLEIADAQALPYGDGTFDTVVATFVFCSVPDPLLGLQEARRVLVPGGRLLLLEHVLSERPGLRPLMRWLDPVPAHLWGAHIDRETVETVRAAGFVDVQAVDRSLDVVKLISARAPGSLPAGPSSAPCSPPGTFLS